MMFYQYWEKRGQTVKGKAGTGAWEGKKKVMRGRQGELIPAEWYRHGTHWQIDSCQATESKEGGDWEKDMPHVGPTWGVSSCGLFGGDRSIAWAIDVSTPPR